MLMHETPRKALGAKLADYRIGAALSQREVSDALGYNTPQFVSNWERGVAVPPSFSLRDLAKLYGVRLKELVDLIIDAQIESLEIERKNMYKMALTK